MLMTQVGRSVALIVAVTVVLVGAACTSSAQNRPLEMRDCQMVGLFTGAPPETARFWRRQITMAQSGNVTAAIDRVRTICGSLRLWQIYR
jgi:hypothetical protein